LLLFPDCAQLLSESLYPSGIKESSFPLAETRRFLRGFLIAYGVWCVNIYN